MASACCYLSPAQRLAWMQIFPRDVHQNTADMVKRTLSVDA